MVDAAVSPIQGIRRIPVVARLIHVYQGRRTAVGLMTNYRKDFPRFRSIDQMPDHFLDELAEEGELIKAHYSSMKDIEAAILRASMGLDHRGKVHPHLRKIPKEAKARAQALLLKRAHLISLARSFEKLHLGMHQIFKHYAPTPGIGPLYIYDVSTFIGHYLGLEPQHVYLHAGARDGAEAIGINTYGRTRIDLGELPTSWQNKLTPDQAETALCAYKDEIRRLLQG